jgi:hypothetical protein
VERRGLEYGPECSTAGYQYGVALIRAGNPKEAVERFSCIIGRESRRILPTETLVTALKTRIIDLGHVGRFDEAHDDLDFAKRLSTEYPHLRAKADHMSEIDDEDDREK